MPTTTYKRMDSDAMIFFTNYILTKLKNSPLAENTTYTVEKNAAGTSFLLKDGDGTTVATISGLLTDAERTKLSGNLATQEYVAQQIASVAHLKFQKVAELPTLSSADTSTIYLVPIANSTDNTNNYTEWYVEVGANDVRRWESLGATTVDLSGYVQASQMASLTNQEITTIVDDAYTAVFSSNQGGGGA